MNVEDLEKYNPWWKTGKVKEGWLKKFKRTLYSTILKYLKDRQILLIEGLRRVGKTTLIFQVIDQLLSESIPPKRILYFSFDEFAFELNDVLTTYQQFILHKVFDDIEDRIYIFLDEIQKYKEWETKIKIFYDLYPNLKFIVTGSAALKLRKRSKESLAGRIFEFTLPPFDFPEFLKFRGFDLDKIKANPKLWKRTLLPLFYYYLKCGAFPEIANEENEEKARNYIRNAIIERIIYKDLPEEMGIKDIELLKSLIYLIGRNPGMILNYREIAKNFGRDQRTISNYIEYLTYSRLLKLIFNYRGSPLATMRKMKKIYFTTPNLIFAFNENLTKLWPKLLENFVVVECDAQFFFRENYEVDVILVKHDLLPVEVKSIPGKLKSLRKFMRKFNRDRALVIDFEEEGTENGIEVIPAWLFALLKDKFIEARKL
ncbi:MAG: ATP-binding protein [Candidatus Helarchaeota archaeon]